MNDDPLDQTDRQIEATVKQAFSKKQVPDRLFARIKKSLEAQQQTNATALIRGRISGLPIRIAASVLIIAAVIILFSLTSQTADDRILTATLVGEHTAFVAAGHSLDINSSDNNVLSSWFSQQLEASRPPAAPLTGSLKLAGGRLCRINGQRVASYAYQLGSKTISLYLTDSTRQLETELPTVENSENLHIATLRNSTYASWRSSGWQYVLVANLPIENFAQISASLSASSLQAE